MVQTSREVDVRYEEYSNSYVAEVKLHHIEEKHGFETATGTEKAGQYVFVKINDETADTLRGELPEIDGTPVVYIGNSAGKHYYYSRDHTEIPVDVYEALESRGLTILSDVGGGWSNWDGRPEWSETYIDLTDSQPVNNSEIIDQRQEA
jgi:hypothetical protein